MAVVLGSALTLGGIVLARHAFTDDAFLGPVLAWVFVGVGMLGAMLLVYKASTVGIVS